MALFPSVSVFLFNFILDATRERREYKKCLFTAVRSAPPGSEAAVHVPCGFPWDLSAGRAAEGRSYCSGDFSGGVSAPGKLTSHWQRGHQEVFEKEKTSSRKCCHWLCFH